MGNVELQKALYTSTLGLLDVLGADLEHVGVLPLQHIQRGLDLTVLLVATPRSLLLDHTAAGGLTRTRAAGSLRAALCSNSLRFGSLFRRCLHAAQSRCRGWASFVHGARLLAIVVAVTSLLF